MTSHDKPRSHRGVPAGVWVLGFVSLLMDLSSEMIHSLLPLFMTGTLGLSVVALGWIEGLAESTALIVKLFSGAISDWMGRRKPLALLGYGLGAATKPLFALAQSGGEVVTARLLDRVGKGIRGAPRDALVADLTPPDRLGAAFGLRQSLDTVGAFLGPLVATALMLLWANDFRRIFWIALIPGSVAVLLLFFGLHEPPHRRVKPSAHPSPLRRAELKHLDRRYWRVVVIGALFSLARFSEAFLVLRAEQAGVALAWTPLVLVMMNLAYSATAYPFGRWSDRSSPDTLLSLGLFVLLAAQGVLSSLPVVGGVWIGVVLWGVHMGITQGVLGAMVASAAPTDLRGTAFGVFSLISGLALLAASVMAGLVWAYWGAARTFQLGGLFSLLSLALLLIWPSHRGRPSGSDAR